MWAAGFAVAAIVLFGLYYLQARTLPVMSDGASNALQAWDMLHGNLLLRGWALTDLSFYTIDLPEYMLTELARGLGPSAAHVAAALTYTLVVIGAAVLAKGHATGREGLVRALVAAGIMLAPPLGSSSATLLNDPDHVGTQVPLLLVWLLLDRARPRLWVPAAVTVLLAWSQVADPLVTYEGVLPLVLLAAFRLYRTRPAASGQLPGWLRGSWYELTLAGGALVSTAIAAVVLRLISRAGGFSLSPPNTTFSAVGALFSHLSVTAESILVLFGADFSGDQLSARALIPLLHLAGVVLAAWAVARALRCFAKMDLLVQVLALAMIVQLAAYVFSQGHDVVSGPHEIAGVLPLGAVLAGRLLAGQLIRDRHLALCAVVLTCYAGVLAHDAVQPPVIDGNAKLAVWLQQHGLKYGLATYWNASSVTVDSGGRVTVRPISRTAKGQVEAIRRDSIQSWYSPRQHTANFIILPPRYGSCAGGKPLQWKTAVRTQFGPPAASYHADGFTILVWNQNLLSNLVAPTSDVC